MSSFEMFSSILSIILFIFFQFSPLPSGFELPIVPRNIIVRIFFVQSVELHFLCSRHSFFCYLFFVLSLGHYCAYKLGEVDIGSSHWISRYWLANICNHKIIEHAPIKEIAKVFSFFKKVFF